jgi:hypothetical protein
MRRKANQDLFEDARTPSRSARTSSFGRIPLRPFRPGTMFLNAKSDQVTGTIAALTFF